MASVSDEFPIFVRFLAYSVFNLVRVVGDSSGLAVIFFSFSFKNCRCFDLVLF